MINMILILIVLNAIVNLITIYKTYKYLTDFTVNIRVYINQLENRLYDEWEKNKLTKFVNAEGLYTNKKRGQ
jgi:predicted Holliday junction resolvase-like endonuclease